MSFTKIEGIGSNGNLGKANEFEFIVSEARVPIRHLGGCNQEKVYAKSQKSDFQSTFITSHAIYNIQLSFPFSSSSNSPLSIHF